MRSSYFRTLLSTVALGGALLAAACSPTFDAEEKSNQKALVQDKDDVTLRLAMAAESGGDLASAERMYQQIAKSSTHSTANLLELTSFYTRHGQPQHAVDLLDKAYNKSPNDVQLLRALANAYISVGNPEKALALLNIAIATNSMDSYLYNSKGVALDKLGKYKEAQEYYRKAIALNPQDEMDFKTNLSMSYILAGRYNSAIELLQPLLSKRDITSSVRQNLALAYGMKGDMDTAMKVGTKDLSIKEMNENIRFYQMISKGGKKDATADAFPLMTPPPGQTAESNAAAEAPDMPPPPPPPEAFADTSANRLSPRITDAVKELKENVPEYKPVPDQASAAEPEAEPANPVTLPLAKKATVVSSLPATDVHEVTVSTAADSKKSRTQSVVQDESDDEFDKGSAATPPKGEIVTSGTLPVPVLKPDKW